MSASLDAPNGMIDEFVANCDAARSRVGLVSIPLSTSQLLWDSQ
jgi:hypothetical protein